MRMHAGVRGQGRPRRVASQGNSVSDVNYMAFVCLMCLDLPTSASVDDRDSDHRPRSVGGVRMPDEP